MAGRPYTHFTAAFCTDHASHVQIVQRELAEDTIWWSVKDATEYTAHRRTVLLFHRNASAADPALAEAAGVQPGDPLPNPLRWVDNTGAVWPSLCSTLNALAPERIALNTDADIGVAGGLHVGEQAALAQGIGERWMTRAVSEPMLAVEYVAARVPGQLRFYRDLQETTWALIEEAFSEKVIQPGVTTTEVSISRNQLCRRNIQ